jgi:hypothetical protein
MPRAAEINAETYRTMVRAKGLCSFRVAVKQTDLLISCGHDLRQVARKLVLHFRRQIEEYIMEHPRFLCSLSPLAADPLAPPVVKAMLEAGRQAGVGPMAAVAGALAEAVGRGLLEFTPEVMVENGGDVFIATDRVREICILAETSELTGLTVALSDYSAPVGVCTSSGRLGHSLSLGRSDAVTAVAPSTALADAAATAIGNQVQGPRDIEKALALAQSLGLVAVAVLVQGRLGLWGGLAVTG